MDGRERLRCRASTCHGRRAAFSRRLDPRYRGRRHARKLREVASRLEAMTIAISAHGFRAATIQKNMGSHMVSTNLAVSSLAAIDSPSSFRPGAMDGCCDPRMKQQANVTPRRSRAWRHMAQSRRPYRRRGVALCGVGTHFKGIAAGTVADDGRSFSALARTSHYGNSRDAPFGGRRD